MKKIIITCIGTASLALAACNNEEEVIEEPVIEDVETSEEDALTEAIENAESAADAMGKELSDATAPEVTAPVPTDNDSENAE